MSKTVQSDTGGVGGDVADISVAILYPGDRVDKMGVPLQRSRMDVAVEPDDAFDRDIVICDNADRDLGKEVFRNQITDAKLVYRMRGDVFHELTLWDMHPVKHWAATELVLPNVDGVVAVSERLAEKFRDQTGIDQVGSAGMAKNVSAWPTVSHRDEELRIVTLTNANYWQKVRAIVEWAKAVDQTLAEFGGRWHVCGAGDHADDVERALQHCDNVEWRGYVDAYEELRKSNLMLHPSYLDGQPNSVLEGMASQLPVITTDFAAFQRFDGPIRTVADRQSLRATLEEMVEPHRREALGKRAMTYVHDQHSPDAIAREYEAFCAELMDDTN